MSALNQKKRRVRIVYLVVAVAALCFVPWHAVQHSVLQHVAPRSSPAQAPAQLAVLGASSSSGDDHLSYDTYCEQHPDKCGYAALLCDDELVRPTPLSLSGSSEAAAAD